MLKAFLFMPVFTCLHRFEMSVVVVVVVSCAKESTFRPAFVCLRANGIQLLTTFDALFGVFRCVTKKK